MLSIRQFIICGAIDDSIFFGAGVARFVWGGRCFAWGSPLWGHSSLGAFLFGMSYQLSLFTHMVNGQENKLMDKIMKNYGHLHDPAGGKNPNPGDLLIYKEYCNSPNLGTFIRVDYERDNCLLFEGQIVDLDNR